MDPWERLRNYRYLYHVLKVNEQKLPDGQVCTPLIQAELRSLEDLIMLFSDLMLSESMGEDNLIVNNQEESSTVGSLKLRRLPLMNKPITLKPWTSYSKNDVYQYPASTHGSARKKNSDIIRGKRILLVDDNSVHLQVTKTLLAKMECHITLAQNGEEALHILQHQSLRGVISPFDFVFMDLSMPKMDGVQAVKLFRTWESALDSPNCRTFIVAVTANDTEGDMVLCAQTGFDGFVTKPLTAKKLLACILTKSDGEKSAKSDGA